MPARRLLCWLLAALALGACSLNLSATAATQPATAPPPHAVGTPFPVPVTWAGLHLTGKLVFTAGTAGVAQLDLASGQMTVLFRPADPQKAYVAAQSVSPDGQTLVLAYAPPAAGAGAQYAYTRLFQMPRDGSRPPELLLGDAQAPETYSNPLWSPDGQFIYYVHYSAAASTGRIERLAYATRQVSTVVADGFWPRLSRDGTQLLYVVQDRATGQNRLFIAAADGQSAGQSARQSARQLAREIALPPVFQFVDSPVFYPDNQTVLFSGATPPPTPKPAGLDPWLGVQVAEADGGPANWWRVPAAGGPAEQLTHIQDSGMYGVFAPDGQHVAYVSASGLYLMTADGQGIVAAARGDVFPGAIWFGTVEWLP